MRVLHVVASSQRRGAEMFAADLVRALDEVGVEQRVVAIRASSGSSAFDPRPTTLGADRRIPGVRVDLRAAWALRRLIRGWAPDVVQAHGGEPLKYVVPATRGDSVRVVYRRIGEAPSLRTGSPRRLVHGALARRADVIVAVADSLRREVLTQLGVSSSRVVTIPNAVDPRRVRPSVGRDVARSALGIPLSAPVSLFLGAFSDEKGPRDQVEVAARVLGERPDAVHLMAGDGVLRTEIERAARNRGLDGRIRFLGSREDVSDLLALCDVLVMSSRTEGMPAVVIEAGMAGRPVTGYAVGGIGEVVVHGETGILVKPFDHRELADAVIGLFRDADMRTALGSAARARCNVKFDIRSVAPRYLELYERMSRGGGPARAGEFRNASSGAAERQRGNRS
jgi:glycosyltransferase involved in cell wall biosynthesis